MPKRIAAVTVVVPDYDEAISYFCGVPAGSGLLLAKARSHEQREHVGDQTGGRVFLFLQTDDFAGDHARYVAAGVRFVEQPRTEPYGTVAVFEDAFGNRWDLIEPA